MRKFLLLSFMLMFAFAFSDSWAQERTVSGKVTSIEDGSTLPGVNVVLKGTTSGTVTDIDGNFKLAVPSEGGSLVFSFIGLATEEVAIGARSVIDIQMSPDVKQLSEVIVTAVGLEANKASIGYSVQNVAADEVRQAQETNVVNALSGKVAGVQIISSAGTPGGSAQINIRGKTSISGGNSPLFVIDGIPIDNSEFGNGTDGVNRSNRAIDINPADIASLTVLKGAAATVLYGIRAANGAIIITTKRGKSGKPVVSFSTSTRVDKVNKLPELQSTYAQGSAVGGVITYRGPETGEGNSFGPKISDLEFDGATDYPYDQGGRLVAAGTGNGVPARAYDNLDNFFVNGVTYDNNLSVAGGSDVANYFVSAGHLYQTGIIPVSDFARTSLRATVSSDITDKLSISMSANYVRSGGYRVQQGSNVSGIMLGLLRNTPTFDIGNGLTGREAAGQVSTYERPSGAQRNYRGGGGYDNPFWTTRNSPFNDVVNRVIGYTAVEYKITDWLSASYKLGIDYYSENIKSAFNIGSRTQSVGEVNLLDRNSKDLNSDLLLKFNKSINDFTVGGVIGHNFYSNQVDTHQTVGTTLSVPKFYDISNTSSVQGFESTARRKLHGVFGQVNVGWDETVFLNLSARNDWSSVLPKDNNSVFYPAVSLGYVVSNTLGLTDTPIFSYIKLRASWGQVGNDGGSAFIYSTDPYFSVATFGGDGFISTGGNFPAFGGVNAFDRNNTLPNGQLKPELTTTSEIGAELKFFKGRLGLDVTYYDSKTEDAIIAVDVAPASGFNSAIQNAAVVTNTGVELVLNASPIRSDDFSWDIDVNFTKYKNTVESLSPGIETVSLAGFVSTTSRAVAGQPYGAIFGAKFLRNDQGELVMGSDGWPEQDPIEGVIGDPNPDWLAGIRNTINFKGVSLSALLDIRQGGDVWNGTYGILKTFGMHEVTAQQREIKGYVFEGVQNTGTDEAPVYVPNTTPVDFYNPRFGASQNKWNRYAFGGLPEENIQDASWVRLREVTLSYALPKSVLSNTFVSDLKVSLSGRNLLLFTEYNGIDPETNLTGASNGFGLDYFNNPNTKSYSVTVSATF